MTTTMTDNYNYTLRDDYDEGRLRYTASHSCCTVTGSGSVSSQTPTAGTVWYDGAREHWQGLGGLDGKDTINLLKRFHGIIKACDR